MVKLRWHDKGRLILGMGIKGVDSIAGGVVGGSQVVR